MNKNKLVTDMVALCLVSHLDSNRITPIEYYKYAKYYY